jgi:hypothetical protein
VTCVVEVGVSLPRKTSGQVILVMSGRGRMMYQCLQPEPEGAILPKRSAPQEVTSSPHDAGASMANWLETNIQGGAVASTPSPQNCTGAISTHAAQALNNAPARYDRAQLRRPTTPLTGRGRPIGLGVNLDVTAAGPATEIGGGRTSEDRYDPADRSALPPAPVGCRLTSANTRGKSARFRAG